MNPVLLILIKRFSKICNISNLLKNKFIIIKNIYLIFAKFLSKFLLLENFDKTKSPSSSYRDSNYNRIVLNNN